MWVQLSDQDRALLTATLDPLTIPEAKDLQARLNPEACAVNPAFIEAANQKYCFGSDGDLGVDDEAVVSHSDAGAYVMMWGWVSNEKAGISEDEDTCRTCGETYPDGGDGFDGECPNCADKTDQKLNPENYE